MPQNNSKISILMPSYNQGIYLEAAIRSVLSQDYPNKELILIDGGSTDNSLEIIKQYQSSLAYSVSEPDHGQAHALNKATAHVTGDIIGWLNSDDCYLPGAFARVAKAFEQNPQAVLVHGDRIMIDSDGHVLGWTALPPFDPASSGYNVCSETAFWRKTCSDRLSFDENLRFAMDLDYFGNLHHIGSFVKLDAYLGAFRCHAESKSSTIHEVGQSEADAQWKKIFPDYPEGWKKAPPAGKGKLLSAFLKHPILIAFPYLYRRFFLRLKDPPLGTQK